MLSNTTGLVLVAVDTANNHYSRYAACAGSKAKLIRGYQADRPLTQGEVETLRTTPDAIAADDPELTAA